MKGIGLPRRKDPTESVRSMRRTDQPGPRFNYELFNGNNFNIRYWSWNYRGCWPRQPVPKDLHNLCIIGAPSYGHPFGWEWHVPQAISGRRPTPWRALHRRSWDHSKDALLGISIGTKAPLAFPDPGCLAGILLSIRECSTSRL